MAGCIRVLANGFDHDRRRDTVREVTIGEAVRDSVKEVNRDTVGALESVQAEVDFLARMNGLLIEMLVRHGVCGVEDVRSLLNRGPGDSRVVRPKLFGEGDGSTVLDLTQSEYASRHGRGS